MQSEAQAGPLSDTPYPPVFRLAPSDKQIQPGRQITAADTGDRQRGRAVDLHDPIQQRLCPRFDRRESFRTPTINRHWKREAHSRHIAASELPVAAPEMPADRAHCTLTKKIPAAHAIFGKYRLRHVL